MRNADLQRFERSHGIHLHGVQDFYDPAWRQDVMAFDAQPTTVTTANAGIPAFLTTFIDPSIIKILVTPNKAAQIFGEAKKGDWTTLTMGFPVVERTGETSAYGDFNTNGSVGANVVFEYRQSFHYQTITQWGERELDMYGEAKINYAATLNDASVLVLDKFQNNSYFFGISGMQNYGLLNDPSLPAAITPTTKAAGGQSWSVALPTEVYADIQKLFAQLIAQTNGLVDANTSIVIAGPPQTMFYLTNTNLYGINVHELIKKNIPNVRFETATQYQSTAGVNEIQMIAETLEGQDTGYCAFTEKLRSHPVVVDLSSYKQKKSQGTWGAIIKMPVAIATMTGM